MRCAILGLIGGVAWLQAQAVLPDAGVQLACALGAASAVLAGARVERQALAFLRAGLAVTAGALAGFAWAAFIAQGALSNELAKSEEGSDFDIVGTVDSLPSRQDNSIRFNFAVESRRMCLRASCCPGIPERGQAAVRRPRFAAGRALAPESSLAAAAWQCQSLRIRLRTLVAGTGYPRHRLRARLGPQRAPVRLCGDPAQRHRTCAPCDP